MKLVFRTLAVGMFSVAVLCGGVGSSAAAGHTPVKPDLTGPNPQVEPRTVAECGDRATAAYNWGMQMGWGEGLAGEYAVLTYEGCIARL
ncbi:hypothetical protein [Embleya hyalina]|uniref:Uncharacterized protein n=1 Tax=Embleya hyalina TaxID=516124 RepID=A0A401YNM7_9ACTN|nr:hypothetical protein [Embleya hyalina]GCD96196.1 hypothetical protein EHYA_03880 [Embleya hyalina]